MANSTSRPSGRKAGDGRPQKPRPDFPLYPHKCGRWAKRVNGQVRYFTKWREDPKGEQALREWLRVKDDLLAGQEPPTIDPDAFSVADLCNQYMDHQEARRERGEISPRSFQCLHATCRKIVQVFSRERAVVDLGPDDFGRLRKELTKTRKAVAMRNEMQRIRGVFRFAFENRLIPEPVRYGTQFTKPGKKQVRREQRQKRDANGRRMFEAEEIRRLLAEAKQPLRAMILLAINCGLGQTDLAELPIQYVDLDSGLIDYPRPKTEADRLCFLWPETLAALREWLPKRPKAKAKADEGLLFLTCRGARFVKAGQSGFATDGIGQEFTKLLRKLGLKKPGRAFYGLRHTFRTVADEVRDPVATNLIMGHTDDSMAAAYREGVDDARLQRVAEHVRRWLFGPGEDGPEGEPEADEAGHEENEQAEQEETDRPILKLFVA